MNRPSLRALERIDAICLQFEAHLQQGARPSIDEELALAKPCDQPRLLFELLLLEIHYRMEIGEAPTAQEYLRRYPRAAVVVADVFRRVSSSQISTSGGRPHTTLRQEGLPEIPGYQILDILGKGGMGVVYKARQPAVGRNVALKVIQSGALARPAEIARFQTEVQLLGRLNHPGIVQVYDWGKFGSPSQAFFAMELCPGGGLDKQIDKRRVRRQPFHPREAANIVKALAKAVGKAHAANIVHRDLKPANVLLDADGEVKVTDFGLAKDMGDPEGMTLTNEILGTPSYMSPEQIPSPSHKVAVSSATDVFAMGVILYELMTDRLPFQAKDRGQLYHQICTKEAQPPRDIRPYLPRDLEIICLKCLRKDSTQRYSQGTALADDLEKFLQGKPIAARPEGVLEKVARLVRREPLLCILIALVLLGLTGGLAVTSWLSASLAAVNRNVTDQRDQLRKQNREIERKNRSLEKAFREKDWQVKRATRAEHATQLDRALEAWRNRDVIRANRYLDRTRLREVGYHHVRRLCQRTARSLQGHAGPVSCVAWSPQGTRLASGGGEHDKILRVWNARTGTLLFDCRGHIGPIRSVSWSRDGTRIASASSDRTIKIWDAESGALLKTLTGHTGPVNSIDWNPNGSRIVSGAGAYHEGLQQFLALEVKIWDVQSGQEIGKLGRPIRHLSPINSVAWSPDGSRILTGAGATGVRRRKFILVELKLWDAATGQQLRDLQGHTAPVTTVGWSPDGNQILSGSADGSLKIWDAVSGKEKRALKGHSGGVTCVAWGPDGQEIVSSGRDATVKVWDASTAQELRSLKAHTGVALCVAWNPQANSIASGGADYQLKIWDTTASQEALILKEQSGPITCVAWSPDGHRAVIGSAKSTANIWDLANGRVLFKLGGHAGPITAVAWSPNGRWILTAGDTTVRVWEATNARPVSVLSGHNAAVTCACWSPDSQWILSGSKDTTLRTWHPGGGPAQRTLQGRNGPITCVCWSPDGKRILSGSSGVGENSQGRIQVWDGVTGRKEAMSFFGLTGKIRSLAWGPQGKRFLSVAEEVQLWDASTGKQLRPLRGYTGGVQCVAWNTQGTHFLTGVDRTVKIWDAETGQEILDLKGHRDTVASVAWSHDDGTILSGSRDQTLRLWDTRPWLH